MTRFLALALATLGCACGSLSETPSSVGPSLVVVRSPEMAQMTSSDASAPRSTVPMTGDQKDGPLDAVARALHVYWFFGSR